MSAYRLPLLLLLAILVAALSIRPQAVRAGDYHDGATLDCSECHVMHPSSIAAGPGRRETVSALPSGDIGPLLKKDVNELCLSCHDGSAKATDVLGPNTGSQPGAVRQAGALNRLGRDGRTATGHTLDARDIAPGSAPSWGPEDENGLGIGLRCTNCHTPHGSIDEPVRTYRNLRSNPGNLPKGSAAVTYNHGAPGANDLSRDVFVRRSLDYDESAVDFNEPRRDDSGLARFCAGCHGSFHGAPGSENVGGTESAGSYAGFVRHPTAGVDVGGRGEPWSSRSVLASRANRVKTLSSSGIWDPATADLTPTCISCHKAHGNGNAFGLIYRSGAGRPTEDGDTGGRTLEHLCGQCHGTGAELAF